MRYFLRDFRGDTIHPSTLELMGELGLLDEFLRLPHQRATTHRGLLRGIANTPLRISPGCLRAASSWR
jgi:hypothetical protein